jgi:uncharacterized membrane protein
MKRGILILLGVVAVPAVVVHGFVVWWLPAYIMGLTLGGFADQGLAVNQWYAAAAVTPRNQPVARADPDLAHALCRLDLSNGPVRVSAPGWGGFAALSVFDARAENVFVTSLSGSDGSTEIVVAMTGQAVAQRAGRPVIWLDAPEALALVRRLAPTPALQQKAAARAAEGDCTPL